MPAATLCAWWFARFWIDGPGGSKGLSAKEAVNRNSRRPWHKVRRLAVALKSRPAVGQRCGAIVRWRVTALQQHIAVAGERRAPADQVAAAEIGQRGQQLWLTPNQRRYSATATACAAASPCMAGLNGLPHLLPGAVASRLLRADCRAAPASGNVL